MNGNSSCVTTTWSGDADQFTDSSRANSPEVILWEIPEKAHVQFQPRANSGSEILDGKEKTRRVRLDGLQIVQTQFVQG
jgi:hypothetical protein